MMDDERFSALEEKLERFLDATCKRLAELEGALSDLQVWVVTHDPAAWDKIAEVHKKRTGG